MPLTLIVMKTYLKMAWRNLWRNKLRTLITMSAIALFVMLSAVMTSTQYGSYDSMVNTIVKFNSGYLQVHQEEYWGSRDINNSFVLSDTAVSRYLGSELVTDYSPRLESFALAATDKVSRGIAVVGIAPESENRISSIGDKLDHGDFLAADDDGVLIGDELGRYLGLDVGDTLSLISVGYHGVSAEMNFPVRGVMHFPVPEQNQRILYMSLPAAQEYFSAYGRVTSLVVMVDDHRYVAGARDDIAAALPEGLSVMTWDEMQPEVVQQVESDKAGGMLMKFILYVIIAFGLYATILMMMSERRREFGVMISVGMQRRRLSRVVFLETLFISLVGALAGIFLSALVVEYLYLNPIPLTGEAASAIEEFGIEPKLFFSNHPKIYYFQAMSVGAIALFVGLFPLRWIKKMNVMEALRA